MEAAAARDAIALVPAMLGEYGATTRVALCDYLGPKEPLRHLYGPVADYPRRGGRMLRPSLCIASARAFGAPLEAAIRTAVAIELLHNAFLVHDDVEDESSHRRGAPTLHALHGVALAVNVGDALTLLGLRALMDNRDRLGPLRAMKLLEAAEQMARETVEGQAIELGWRHDNAVHLTDASYLLMVLKKTCWYTTIFPLVAGALIGSGRDRSSDALTRAGFFLGAAFQIQDDVLNLAADARYGKERCGDLWEGKRTLMLIHLLRALPPDDRSRLIRFLERPRSERSADDVRWIEERMGEHGSLEHARTVAGALAGVAEFEIGRSLAGAADSRDKQFLCAMARWVLLRA